MKMSKPSSPEVPGHKRTTQARTHAPGITAARERRVKDRVEDVLVAGHSRSRSRPAHAPCTRSSSSAVASYSTSHGHALPARLQPIVLMQQVGEIVHGGKHTQLSLRRDPALTNPPFSSLPSPRSPACVRACAMRALWTSRDTKCAAHDLAAQMVGWHSTRIYDLGLVEFCGPFWRPRVLDQRGLLHGTSEESSSSSTCSGFRSRGVSALPHHPLSLGGQFNIPTSHFCTSFLSI